MKISIALTGASGIVYGLRLIECVLKAGHQVRLVYSQAAQIVARMEADIELPSSAQQAQIQLSDYFQTEQLRVYGRQEWTAPIASGSNPSHAMVICPCTTGTLAAIAQGRCQNLIERAADVMLKEGKKIIIVLRETPYSIIHLQNMLNLAQAGAILLPANPGFYHRPQSVQSLVDFIVARILDQLHIEHQLLPAWGDD